MEQKQNLGGIKVTPPGDPSTWIGKRWRKFVCDVLTCVLNPRLTIPIDIGDGFPKPRDATITMGPNGWTALFPAVAGAGVTAANTVPFEGAGPPDSSTLLSGYSYLANPTPSLYVDTSADTLYYCTTAGSDSTSVWAEIVGGSGSVSAVRQFKYSSQAGDYLLCKTFDGTTTGTIDIPILKCPKLRNSITSQTLFGNGYTYSYASSGSPAFYTRTASLGGETEDQVVIPQFLSNDLIYATTSVDALGCPRTVLSAAIVSGGTGYTNGDVLTVSGGTSTTAAVITVTSVSGGVITGASVTTHGIYSVLPSNAVSVSGGTGSSAAFDLTWSDQYIDLNIDGRAWAS